MKHKLLFVAILLTLVFNGFSQSTYSRILDSAQVYSAVSDANNNIYLAGQGYSTSYNFDGMLIASLTPDANIIWAKKIGSSYTDYANAIVNKGDTLFVAGTAYNQGLGYNNFSCVKMALNGDTLWSRSIDFGAKSVASSAYYCPDNSFLVTGWVLSASVVGVAKLTANGDLVWAKTFDNPGFYSNPRSIKQLDNGNIVIVGDFDHYYGFCLKLDSNGALLTAKKFQTPQLEMLYLNDFILNTDGMVLFFNAVKTFIAQVDTIFNPVWAIGNNWGFSGWSYSELARPKLIETNDNGYIYVDPVDWDFGPGFAFKADSIGHIEWATYLDMPLQGIFPMNDGGYLAYGNGPIMGVKSTKINEPQIGLVKIDSTGYSDSCSNPISFTESSIELVVSDALLTELYSGTLVYHLLQISDVNLLKRSGCVDFTGGIGETNAIPFQLIATPNPTQGMFELSFSDNQNHQITNLEIVNAIGEVVYQLPKPIKPTITIDLSQQPTGIYLLRASTNNNVLVAKVLVVD